MSSGQSCGENDCVWAGHCVWKECSVKNIDNVPSFPPPLPSPAYPTLTPLTLEQQAGYLPYIQNFHVCGLVNADVKPHSALGI